MLTDRPYIGTNPYHSLPIYMMESNTANISVPQSLNKRTVSSNTPAEYADRFHSRPSGRPHVVGFDGRGVTSRSGRHDTRGFNGFFPSMKLRIATPTKTTSVEPTRSKSCKAKPEYDKPKSTRSNKTQPPFILELAPERNTGSPHSQASNRTAPARVMSSRSAKTIVPSNVTSSQPSSRATARTLRASYESHPPVYPYIIENPQKQVDDLTELPKPMMVISRDNPWVYRYKVKRSMNELSKIMASKPPPVGFSQSTFIH